MKDPPLICEGRPVRFRNNSELTKYEREFIVQVKKELWLSEEDNPELVIAMAFQKWEIEGPEGDTSPSDIVCVTYHPLQHRPLTPVPVSLLVILDP